MSLNFGKKKITVDGKNWDDLTQEEKIKTINDLKNARDEIKKSINDQQNGSDSKFEEIIKRGVVKTLKSSLKKIEEKINELENK
jgi:phosphopantothenate synthetase